MSNTHSPITLTPTTPSQRKLDLECRLEEERLKIESEKTELEKDKVSLQTRVKQLGEQSEWREQFTAM